MLAVVISGLKIIQNVFFTGHLLFNRLNETDEAGPCLIGAPHSGHTQRERTCVGFSCACRFYHMSHGISLCHMESNSVWSLLTCVVDNSVPIY